ncbi:MAG: SelB C-terminal domain-containing protein, partial [Alphaproteobacteria bacterium]
MAETLAAETPDGLFTAAVYRDHSGIGRNLTIRLLEFFDRSGFTRRVRDDRRILKPAAEVFGAPPA